MTPERYKQVLALFEAAAERDANARDSFLAQACHGDEALLVEVKRMLAADEKTEEFLEKPPGELAAAALRTLPSEPIIGRRFGEYRIVSRLGSGGMGAVYTAIRADDQFQRKVAIKLVRTGQDSEEMLRRFRLERQTLAALDHPNIVKLLDGGTTDDGIPFLVMEYVDGLPIDKYCDRLKLPITDRLHLFRSVCAGVHYAHQNLVVHRDLKPGNILVTADGQPKLSISASPSSCGRSLDAAWD